VEKEEKKKRRKKREKKKKKDGGDGGKKKKKKKWLSLHGEVFGCWLGKLGSRVDDGVRYATKSLLSLAKREAKTEKRVIIKNK